MEISELILTLLNEEPDGIDGRTVIQKLGYFSSVKLGMDAGYGPDLYGPFSPSVAAHMKNLTGLDFMIEKGRRTIRDRIMYSYSLTEDGRQLAERVEEEYPEKYSIVKDIIEKCRNIAHLNFNVLSWAAKVHFIVSQTKEPITYEKAIEVGRLFSWELNEREIESAARLLTALGLIEER